MKSLNMKSFKTFAAAALVGMTLSGVAAFAQEATSGKKGATTTTSAPTQTTPTSSEGKKARSGPIKTSKITRGTVVNLHTMKKVNAADAGALSNKGALALMVGSRIIYVLKADGSSAGDDLARLADGKVGVAGKTVSKGGATVILADVIDVIK